MYLRDLDNRDFTVCLLQTSSPKMETFIKDKVKRKYHGRQDTIIDVEKTTDLKDVRGVLGIVPPFSEKWVVNVKVESVDRKQLVNTIKSSTTCVFFCTVSKYKNYKEFKDSLKGVDVVFDYYMNYLRRLDVIYLYDCFVPKERRFTKMLFDYVVQSYSGDIDSIFDIFLALGSGKELKTRGDIAKIGGIGGLTIESFIFSLLKEPPTTVKGLKRVMKNRITAGKELGQLYGFSKFYSYMNRSLMTMIELKMLLLSGEVYKSVKSLPDGYDEKRIARYQKYIWRLKSIPLRNLLVLRETMGSRRWSDDTGFLSFYYKLVRGYYVC